MEHISIPDNTILEKSYEMSESNVETVLIGDTVVISGDYILARCHKIKELFVPSGTIVSGYGLFYCSNSLEVLNIGDNVNLSGNYIFQECTNLTSLAIGRTSIISGNHSFSSLKMLQNLRFSPDTTFFGDNLFANCEMIKEVIIPDYCIISGDWFFKKCHNLERIVIGDNVVISGNNCFKGCNSIKSITIGDNFRITGLNFLEDCFENQNVELFIGHNYVGHPIYIPQKIFHVNKYSDIKDTLLYKTDKCMISHEEFNDDTEVVVLQCGHVLSLESLNEWIKIQKICPLCRQGI
jgi:carbonic anhydrase/acetyltransferase-like protein (isoleucine patch superfamily)